MGIHTKMMASVAVAAVLSVGALQKAEASTALTLDDDWTTFLFGDVGSSWSDSFTFTIASTAYLAVTDAFLSGDRFEFFSNGVSLGLTSAPTTQGDDIGNDYAAAFTDARWSSAEAIFAAGSYTITGLTIDSPFGSGGAAIQLSSQSLGGPSFEPVNPIPLPAAGWLLLGALGGLVGLGRRRRRAA